MNIAEPLELHWEAVTVDATGKTIDGSVEYEVRFASGNNRVSVLANKNSIQVDAELIGLFPASWTAQVFSRIVKNKEASAWSSASNTQPFTLESASLPPAPKNLRIG